MIIWTLIACSQSLQPLNATHKDSLSSDSYPLDVQLVDGSQRKVSILSMRDGIYQLQTMVGVLSVPAEAIQRIETEDANTRPPPVALPPAAPAEPVIEVAARELAAPPHSAEFSAQINAFRQSLMTDPAALDAVMSLSANTNIMSIAQDPEIRSLIQAGDLIPLQQHPRIIALMAEPGIVQLLETVAP